MILEKKQETNIQLNMEEMLDIVGPYGKFQKRVNLLFCIFSIPLLYQVMIIYFSSDAPTWTCTVNSTTCTSNRTFHASDRRRCDPEWVRSDWQFTESRDYSIVTQFDVYCDNEWMMQLLTSVFFIGWLVGAIVLGMCADNFGRRIVFLASMIVVLVGGFLGIFIPSLYFLIVCRFVIGFALPGTFSQMFILATEIVGRRHRAFAGITILAFCQLSFAILAIKAYFIRQWKYLNIVCTVPYFFLFYFCKYIPESIRYLRVKGRFEELNDTLHKMAHCNGNKIPSYITIAPIHQASKSHNLGSSNNHDSNPIIGHESNPVIGHDSNPSHLFRTKLFIKRTVILTFAYFTNGLVYYGLYLCSGDLGGNRYRDFFILAIAEVPLSFTSIYICDRFGRKMTSLVPMLLATFACCGLGLTTTKSNWTKAFRVIVGIIGKCMVGSNSNTMSTWSTEMYPTLLRGDAMGFFQAFMRLGAAVSPWIVDRLSKVNEASSYLLMAALSFITFSLLCMLSETKGVTTDDMDADEKNTSSSTSNSSSVI